MINIFSSCGFYSEESAGDSGTLNGASPLPYGNTFIPYGGENKQFLFFPTPEREKYVTFGVKRGTASHTSGGGQPFLKHLFDFQRRDLVLHRMVLIIFKKGRRTLACSP